MTLHDVAVKKLEELIFFAVAANHTIRIIVYLEGCHGHQMVVCGVIIGYKAVWLLFAGWYVILTFVESSCAITNVSEEARINPRKFWS